MEQHTKQVIDHTIALTALASPWWLQVLQNGAAIFMLVGGAVLLSLRILIAFREWMHPPKGDGK